MSLVSTDAAGVLQWFFFLPFGFFISESAIRSIALVASGLRVRIPVRELRHWSCN